MTTATVINVFQGDTKPDIFIQLYDPATGEALKLSDPGRIVYANFRKRGNSTVLIADRACEKVAGGEDAGQVVFTWPAAITWEPGWYELELYVRDGATDIQTMDDVVRVRIKADF